MAVTSGRIDAFGPDKLIDAKLADRQWAENTRSRAANDAATVQGAELLLTDAGGPGRAPSSPDEAAGAAGVPMSLQADPGYQEARSRQAQADARMAELKLAETEGLLVRMDQVRATFASRLAPVREGLLQIPARVASVLAAQSDPGRIQVLLETEIHRVLAPLATLSAAKAQEESEGP